MIHALVNRSVERIMIFKTPFFLVVSMPSWVAIKYNFTEFVNKTSTKKFLEIRKLGVNVLKYSRQNAENSTGESNKVSMF